MSRLLWIHKVHFCIYWTVSCARWIQFRPQIQISWSKDLWEANSSSFSGIIPCLSCGQKANFRTHWTMSWTRLNHFTESRTDSKDRSFCFEAYSCSGGQISSLSWNPNVCQRLQEPVTWLHLSSVIYVFLNPNPSLKLCRPKWRVVSPKLKNHPFVIWVIKF